VNEKNVKLGNQIHNFISSSSSGTVINYGSGSEFLTSYGSGSASQKVTVPVPQQWQNRQKLGYLCASEEVEVRECGHDEERRGKKSVKSSCSPRAQVF
jgi:hypothetical protein